MKKRTPLALLTATSALLIPIVPAQAAEQPKETVELHGAVGDAVNAGATALGIPGAGQMDIGRIAEGLIGVIDRAGGGGKIIDLTSGDTISIDPAVLRTLEGVAPPLKALRGLTNTSGPALDLLKQIIADGDNLDLPKLSDLLDKADAPSSSRSGLLDRLGNSDRSSSKPELSSRLGSLLDRNRDKETTTTPTTTSARDKQDGFKPDSVNGDTTDHSLLDRLRGLGGKNGDEDTTIDADKLDKGDYHITGTYVDQNGEKRPVDLKLTVGGDNNDSWEDNTDGKDKEDKDKEGDKETTTSSSENRGESDSDSGSNSESGENSNSDSGSDKGNTEPTDEVDTHAQKPEKRVMPISDNTDGSSSESNSDSGQQGQTTPTTANGTSNGASNGSSTINQNRTVGNTQRGNSTAAQNTTPAPAPNNTANTNAASQNNPESLPTTGAGLRWAGLGAIALAVVGAVVLFANRKKTAK